VSGATSDWQHRHLDLRYLLAPIIARNFHPNHHPVRHCPLILELATDKGRRVDYGEGNTILTRFGSGDGRAAVFAAIGLGAVKNVGIAAGALTCWQDGVNSGRMWIDHVEEGDGD
jgi:hypothetical protein